MAHTFIILDEKLVNTALKITGLKTYDELIDYALRELLKYEKKERLLKLYGRVRWEGDLNESRMRRNDV